MAKEYMTSEDWIVAYDHKQICEEKPLYVLLTPQDYEHLPESVVQDGIFQHDVSHLQIIYGKTAERIEEIDQQIAELLEERQELVKTTKERRKAKESDFLRRE